MDTYFRYHLVSGFAVFGYICAAMYQYGTISVVGPAFENMEVTLKATPFYPWGCDVEWKYMLDGGTTFQTMNGPNIERYLEDGSFFLKWTASIEYNKSVFYAGCSTNTTIRTHMVSLDMTERPSYPVLGRKYPDFNTTECIYVYKGSDFYCKTENGTEPVQLFLLFGQKSYADDESKGIKGLYRINNVHQQMDGLSRRNVTCQVSYAALETPYEVHGILCNVEKGSLPVLTVPEFLDGENSTAICEVRDAIPAPLIEIRVGNVLLSDAQQIDSFNGSSHTFTSKTTVTKTNQVWDGKEMCCDRKSKDDFGLKDVSVCKNISIRYPPSELSMSVNKIHEYSNNMSVCFLNMSCEMDVSNPPCIIEWSSDNDNLRYVYRNDWTNGQNGSSRFISNVCYNVTADMPGGTITCSTRCGHFPSVSDKSYTVSFSDVPILYLNITSPVALHPNITVIVKCFVVDLSNSEQWTFWWEDANKTVIQNCIKVEQCLLTLNYTGDGDKRYICNTRKSKELLRNSLTVSSSRTDEATTNPAKVVTQQWHLVLYAVAGILLVLLVTTFTVLLFRRCKPRVYETLLRRRRTAVRGQSLQVYDVVQANVATTALHNLGGVSASAIENEHVPSPLDLEENEVRSNVNVSHYDYVDTTSDHRDSRTNAPDANFIHAI
ncbi:uncharacterized protein LOC128245434 isoform X1 [Mya arenaria]|uniref:uncharacterized protein LOC128245434 isoform X1 n=1 Tax=Mya arenaria TaxID=6604 RepID=UPI0022E7E34B|nr:uncharacterized protein LOC128245434 isoform X1 [Mya arenaria]